MAQVNWTELLYRQLKRELGRPSPDWWQRSATIASILSSIVIAGVGLLLTKSFQNAQLEITKAQFEAAKVKNEDDRKGQAAKLAADLIPHLFSESPESREFATDLLKQVWRGPELDEILRVVAKKDKSTNVRKAAIPALSSNNPAAAQTLAEIAADTSRPTDERALALSRISSSNLARVTARIVGASRSASFIWDGALVPLVHRGDQYKADFQSPTGRHIYSIAVFGSPGDAWKATLTDGKETQNQSGHVSPGGIGVTSDTLFYTAGLGNYVETGSQFLRQAWCRDLLSVVNKSLTVAASIPADAECSTVVPLVEAALAKSPPVDQKVNDRDRLVVSQLKAVMSELSGESSLTAQTRVCDALKDQLVGHSFCPGSGGILKTVEEQRRTYPDLYRKIVKGP